MSIINVEPKTFVAAPHHHSAKSFMSYLNSAEPHNTDSYIKERNERVSGNYGDVGAVIDRQKKEMNYKKNSVQAFSVVQSFAAEELDYRNPDDIDLAHIIGKETAERLNQKFGGKRAWGVYTQADNEHHRLHNHIVLLNYDRDGRPIKNGLKWKKDLLPINEEVTAKYLTSDKQRRVRQKTYQTAKAIAEADTTKNGEQRRERQQKAQDYVKEAVLDSMKRATSEKQFTEMLEKKGIVTQARYKGKGYGIGKDDIEYSWRTKSNTTKLRKTLGFTYNGTTYRTTRFNLTPQAIVDQIKNNRQRLRQRQAAIEKQADKQQPIAKPVTSKQKPAIVKPQKASHTKTPDLQPQPAATYKPKAQKPQVVTNKQQDNKPIKPSVYFSQQDMINHLRERLEAIRQQMDQEKNKQKQQWLAQQSDNLDTLLAGITSQQMVMEAEQARLQKLRQQRREQEADLTL